MEENVLKDFETFNEFPNKYLRVNSNSNYYFIQKLNKNFITKKNIDSISTINIFNKEKIVMKKSYIDVNTGLVALKVGSIKNVDGDNEEFIYNEDDVKIISLSSILNIKGNDVYYLSKEDIETIVNFKEENAKTYNLESRKYYF